MTFPGYFDSFVKGRQILIEIGSNSVKYVICKKTDDRYDYIMDRNEITSLGEGLVQSGYLSEPAIERTLDSIKKFVNAFDLPDRKNILTVGTMALRYASNTEYFADRLKEMGLDLTVLSGSEEARFSLKGIVSNVLLPGGKGVVFDTGGGSTEFIEVDNGDFIKSVSLDIGAVILTDKFFKSISNDKSVWKRANEEIFDVMSHYLSGFLPVSYVIGSGGNLLTMASVAQGGKFDKYKLRDIKMDLTKSEVNRQIEIYKRSSVNDIAAIPGMERERAPIILGGASIIVSVMEFFSVPRITVSCGGIRHGIMEILFETSRKR